MKALSLLGLLLTALSFPSCTQGVGRATQAPADPLRPATLKLTVSAGSNPSDEVRCGVQDRAGNLWFGTTGDGVFRFDGKHFTQYTVSDGLNSQRVWSILQDKQGRIWFGTDAGLCRWDGTRIERVVISSAFGALFPVPLTSSEIVTDEPAVWSMLEDTTGTIWLGTAAGVLCYRDGLLSDFLGSAKVRNPSDLRLRMVDDILEDRQGSIWLASGMPPGMEGLCRFDGTSIEQFNPGGERWIRTVKQDPRGVLWIGTRTQGAWRSDGTSFSRQTEPPGLGEPLLVDRSGNIWFSGVEVERSVESKQGIWRFDGKTFRNFSTADGMGRFFAWCAVEDRDGNIWIGTRNTGLYRFDGRSFSTLSE